MQMIRKDDAVRIERVRFKEIDSDRIRIKQTLPHGITVALFAFVPGLTTAIVMASTEPEGIFYPMLLFLCLAVFALSVFTDVFKRVVTINRREKTVSYQSRIPRNKLECSVYALGAVEMQEETRVYQYGVGSGPKTYIKEGKNEGKILFSVYSLDLFWGKFLQYVHYLDNSWMIKGPTVAVEKQIRLMKIPSDDKIILKKRDEFFEQLGLKVENSGRKPSPKRTVRYRRKRRDNTQ